MNGLTVERAKAQARALRQALARAGTAVGHAQALELVAQQHGARDWNTLHARLSRRNAPEALTLSPGDRVQGRYLGQAYTGVVVGLSGPAHNRRVDIQFDSPVDVVPFDSFSNWRSRVRGTIGADGASLRRTSDGMPQLTVARRSE